MNTHLLQQLKHWRDEQARKEGREAYFVFGNKVLEDTVVTNPQTTYDLLQIKGWGEKKVMKYGKQVLQLLHGEAVKEQPHALVQKNSEINVDTISNPEIPIFSVVGFLDQVNDILSRMGMVKVRGELHDVNERAGNVYVHLKDLEQGNTLISCFVSRWVVEYYSHVISEGADVVIFARPSVYKNGRFSLLVDRIEPVGEGGHLRALALLKKKLATKGVFAEERKRPIPRHVERIGIITSLSGAAIQDFKKNVGNGGYEFVLQDVRVEGDLAEQSIIEAIRAFNVRRPDLDVLLLMRGGGSVENLKAFNSELVAEAIAASRLPILSAVGHEKDVSIADLVADVSCSTPTAAAHFIRARREELRQTVLRASDTILSSTRELVTAVNHRIDIQERGVFQILQQLFTATRARLDQTISGVTLSYQRVQQQFLVKEHQVADCAIQLANRIAQAQQRVTLAETVAKANNPLRLLEKGYAIVYNETRGIVTSVGDVQSGDVISVQLLDGEFNAKVDT